MQESAVGGLDRVMTRQIILLLAVVIMSGCAVRPGKPLHRRGDEIVVCGQLYHTGAPVVLWTDPGGYDAYRVEKRFVPWEKAGWENTSPPSGQTRPAPNRYGLRFAEAGKGAGGAGEKLPEETFERVRGGGWDLATLREQVDQFVIHYDVCGTSRQCFHVLQDERGLSVHFMLDVDGTIYQTLDVKERAWHATTSNDRSVGVEIANIGAYPVPKDEPLPKTLREWYTPESIGGVRYARLTIPAVYGDGGVRTPRFVGRAARAEPVVGEIQGRQLIMYDLTPEQYDSLIKLTAALCTVLPGIACDVPRDERGRVVTRKLPDERLKSYRGVLGHYHIQENKTDPGPALDWERVMRGARGAMR